MIHVYDERSERVVQNVAEIFQQSATRKIRTVYVVSTFLQQGAISPTYLQCVITCMVQ